LEKIPEVVTLSSQKLVSELKETAKMTSGNKGKIERGKARKKQISEPTPQSSRIEIRIGQQRQTPEPTPRAFKIKIKSTQEKQVSRPTTVIKMKKRKLFEETSTPISKPEEVSLPI
jgi:hypothetical protein